MSLNYYESIAHKMLQVPIDPEAHNVIFTDGNGGYTVKHFNEDVSFDKLVSRMESFNAEKKTLGVRCLMVSSPNWFLRELDGHPEAMITICSPMEDPIFESNGLRNKGRLADEYLIPDRRQEAADLIGYDPELLPLAEMAIESMVTIDGRTPWEE